MPVMLFPKVANCSYLVSRTVSTVSALIFAFIYSKELGLTNRSLVTFVMASNLLIWILITSGTTLTIRRMLIMNLDVQKRKSFNSLILIEMTLALFLFITTIELYSSLKNYLAPNYIIGSVIYCLVSGFHLIVVEMLLASNKFRLSGYLDMNTIFLQIFFFYALKVFAEVSISVRLLISFSLSYIIIAFIGMYSISSSGNFTAGFEDPRAFFRETHGNHTIATVLGIVDRLDRLIISWLLPITVVGKYAVMSGLISFFRFVPDALSKIIISSKSAAWQNYSNNPIFLLTGLTSLISGMIYSSQFLIGHILGPEWLLPWSVSFIFALQEFARGAFQIEGNHKVSIGSSRKTHKASIILLFTAGPLSILFVIWKGVIGVPLGFLLSYTGLLLFMRKGNELV